MGVVRTADDEAELAGVIGHEIAHVAKQHSRPPGEQKEKAATGPSPLGSEGGKPVIERVSLVTLKARNGLVLYLTFILPEHDLSLLKPAFDKMLASLLVK